MTRPKQTSFRMQCSADQAHYVKSMFMLFRAYVRHGRHNVDTDLRDGVVPAILLGMAALDDDTVEFVRRHYKDYEDNFDLKLACLYDTPTGGLFFQGLDYPDLLIAGEFIRFAMAKLHIPGVVHIKFTLIEPQNLSEGYAGGHTIITAEGRYTLTDYDVVACALQKIDANRKAVQSIARTED